MEALDGERLRPAHAVLVVHLGRVGRVQLGGIAARLSAGGGQALWIVTRFGFYAPGLEQAGLPASHVIHAEARDDAEGQVIHVICDRIVDHGDLLRRIGDMDWQHRTGRGDGAQAELQLLMAPRKQRDDEARAILRANDRGGYSVPNGRVYPFQWNWDSTFVALGFATFDRDRAWGEIETLFEAQWADGFVPHIVFWQDDAGYFPGPDRWRAGEGARTSGITQPPVAASIVRSLWEDDPTARQRLAALVPKLLAWHR